MALLPILTLAVNSDITTGIATDSTVYGGAEPARNSLGVFVVYRKINASGEATNIVTLPDNADPNLVTSWTFDYGDDGRYSGLYIAVPNYTVATYALNDCVHSSGVVYQSQSSGNVSTNLLDTNFWLPIASPALLVVAENVPANCTTANLQVILNRKTNRYVGDFALEASLDCDCSNIDTHNYFYTLQLYNEGMIIANSRARFADGEKLAVKAKKLYTTCLANGI